MKCFPDQNLLSTTKSSLCRKFCPTKIFSKDILMYVKNILRMTFHYVIIAMISEFQNNFSDHLKDNAYQNAFSLLFHRIHFNRS